MHFAIANGNIDTVEYMCQKHDSLQGLLDDQGRTPLHIACQGFSHEIVKCIYQNTQENFYQMDKNGSLPIHYAVDNDKKIDILVYFCEKTSCDVLVKNGKGQNVLHIACEKNCIVLVSYLIEKRKIDSQTPDKDSNLVIHIASREGNIEIVRYLTEQDIDINAARIDGMTPLSIAYKGRHRNLVYEYLVNEAPQTNKLLQDKVGYLDGKEERHLNLEENIFGHEANINPQRNYIQTPLPMAC